jgi:hypothetical protein
MFCFDALHARVVSSRLSSWVQAELVPVIASARDEVPDLAQDLVCDNMFEQHGED